MSSTNLELVREIYADVARGDYGSASWADPEIEYEVVDGPEPAAPGRVPLVSRPSCARCSERSRICATNLRSIASWTKLTFSCSAVSAARKGERSGG
jgi:hypothetical protein